MSILEAKYALCELELAHIKTSAVNLEKMIADFKQKDKKVERVRNAFSNDNQLKSQKQGE